MKTEQVSNHWNDVATFMWHAKQETPQSPVVPPESVRKLRASLILEEALETINALGFSVYGLDEFDDPADELRPGHFELQPDRHASLVEIIDGCCDIAVVTTGTLVACGIPDLPFQNAVNQNNLDKFGPGHSFREDGKLIKPPGHKPPDIAAILKSLES